MKKLLIAICAILAAATARVAVITATGDAPSHLLGVEECTWGPSYWCENIKTAASCNATGHCIKTKWERMEVPEDNDSVCDVCKDMVRQARDQLESNQTQEDLRAVFEGSCRLIRVKPIVKECVSLVDEFIPELVETLASQMNPSVVCSVAGLCNSARIDKMLQEYEEPRVKKEVAKVHSLENDELEPDECSKCYTVATHMENKLQGTGPDDFLKQLLIVCREFGSFSDACSSIAITHFDEIYQHTKENFNAENICHLSGQCADRFHKHEDENTPKVEIRPLSTVGMVEITDDLPCKLCEQLVTHLKDLLVANTTEVEFLQVLKGLCKQTKSFATECTAIVEEYYSDIYEYLTRGLNSNMVCQMSGLCPNPSKSAEDVPLAPMLPPPQREIAVRIFNGAAKPEKQITDSTEELTASEVEALQLPIERTMPFFLPQKQATGKEWCTLCEYILHYVQNQVTDPKNEEKVKNAMKEICEEMPSKIKSECDEFVETYSDAVVAILAEEIDPSQVCPMLHLCPSKELLKIWELVGNDYVKEKHIADKPSCPLCLLAVSQIYNVIKDNKTEASIEAELDKLCNHLPRSLTDQCVDLVKAYSKELVELLLADLSPQEVCVYIKLCDDQKDPEPRNLFITDKNGEILTNEIPDYSPRPVIQSRVNDNGCIICEFIMQYIDKVIGNEKTRQKIEKTVRNVCDHLPKTISRECNNFVDMYVDALISILSEDVSPKEACTVMGICKVNEKRIRESIEECTMCRSLVTNIDKLWNFPTSRAGDLEEVVSKVCTHIPPSKQQKCSRLLKVYKPSIINMFKKSTDVQDMCTEMALCSSNDFLALALNSSRSRRSYEVVKRCTWGRSYWCSTNETARQCKAVKECKEKVWKAESAPDSMQTAVNEEESV